MGCSLCFSRTGDASSYVYFPQTVVAVPTRGVCLYLCVYEFSNFEGCTRYRVCLYFPSTWWLHSEGVVWVCAHIHICIYFPVRGLQRWAIMCLCEHTFHSVQWLYQVLYEYIFPSVIAAWDIEYVWRLPWLCCPWKTFYYSALLCLPRTGLKLCGHLRKVMLQVPWTEWSEISTEKTFWSYYRLDAIIHKRLLLSVSREETLFGICCIRGLTV